MKPVLSRLSPGNQAKLFIDIIHIHNTWWWFALTNGVLQCAVFYVYVSTDGCTSTNQNCCIYSSYNIKKGEKYFLLQKLPKGVIKVAKNWQELLYIWSFHLGWGREVEKLCININPNSWNGTTVGARKQTIRHTCCNQTTWKGFFWRHSHLNRPSDIQTLQFTKSPEAAGWRSAVRHRQGRHLAPEALVSLVCPTLLAFSAFFWLIWQVESATAHWWGKSVWLANGEGVSVQKKEAEEGTASSACHCCIHTPSLSLLNYLLCLFISAILNVLIRHSPD